MFRFNLFSFLFAFSIYILLRFLFIGCVFLFVFDPSRPPYFFTLLLLLKFDFQFLIIFFSFFLSFFKADLKGRSKFFLPCPVPKSLVLAG